MSHILVVGKKFSGLTDRIIKNGNDYTLLQDKLTTQFPERKIARRVVADFSTTESLFKTVDKIHHDHPIDGVISIYENYILQTALIGEHLDLPHLPVAAAEACTDKYIMRSLFAQAPEKISPAFAVVENEEDVRKFAEDHDLPIILKPANLAKSLLVTKNNSIEELVKNYHHSVELLQTTYKKYAPGRTPKLIIEEFMQGSVHSVDAFVMKDGTPHVLEQIVDYQTGYDIGYDDNFHYSRILPSKLSINDQKALRHCAEVGIRALGMKNSPAHVEIIMTYQGPRIVEIGARNGGYRDRMHEMANGIDIGSAALDLAIGNSPSIVTKRNEPCAVLELFPKKPGIFDGISHLENLQKLPSLKHLSIKAIKGNHVGKAADGHKMVAVVILHHPTIKQFNHDLDYTNNHCHVMTH